jgi:hypothetical protein
VRISRFGYALSIGATALLAGCGGSQPPMSAYGTSATTPTLSQHRTFRYTGKEQSFIVPTAVKHVTVVASGASGPYGAVTRSCAVSGGRGGLVRAAIPVTPGEKLAVFVGGEGEIGDQCGYDQNGDGGFNGGGNGGGVYLMGSDDRVGGGGGGASDVRQGGSDLQDRVVVAAGGGGPGGYTLTGGGAGGGKIGGRGSAQSGSVNCNGYGGEGGTQNKGGNGGRGAPHSKSENGSDGVLGQGGSGGGGVNFVGAGGGGGGGGYFGGGGGGSGASCSTYSVGAGGGGGGGSSYIEPGASDVKDQKGAAPSGNGEIVISW